MNALFSPEVGDAVADLAASGDPTTLEEADEIVFDSLNLSSILCSSSTAALVAAAAAPAANPPITEKRPLCSTSPVADPGATGASAVAAGSGAFEEVLVLDEPISGLARSEYIVILNFQYSSFAFPWSFSKVKVYLTLLRSKTSSGRSRSGLSDIRSDLFNSSNTISFAFS